MLRWGDVVSPRAGLERVAELSGTSCPKPAHVVSASCAGDDVGAELASHVLSYRWCRFSTSCSGLHGQLKDAADQAQTQSGKINAFLQETPGGHVATATTESHGTQATLCSSGAEARSVRCGSV